MESKLTRRAFLFAQPAILAGDTLLTTNGLSTPTTPTNSDLKTIQQLSKRLEPKFSFDINNIYNINNRDYKVHPNPQAISQSLLLLAFSEGGKSELENVFRFLSQAGIDIHFNSSTSVNAYTRYSKLPGEHVDVSFDGGIVGDIITHPEYRHDNAYFHEFYHIIQQARNPNWHLPLKLFDMAGFLANMGFIGYKTESLVSTFTRRNFHYTIAATLTIALNELLKPGLSPYEWQAYMMTGNLKGDGQLTKLDPFQQLRGTLFLIEPASS